MVMVGGLALSVVEGELMHGEEEERETRLRVYKGNAWCVCEQTRRRLKLLPNTATTRAHHASSASFATYHAT